MKITLINDAGPTGVEAHGAGCRDIAKKVGTGMFKLDHYTEEYASKHEAWAEYNSDFNEEETGGTWNIHWMPCTNGIPDDTPLIEAVNYEAPARVVGDLTKTGAHELVGYAQSELRSANAAIYTDNADELRVALEQARYHVEKLLLRLEEQGVNGVPEPTTEAEQPA